MISPRSTRIQDIEGLSRLLNQSGIDFGAEDLMDAFWLASQMGPLPEVSITPKMPVSASSKTSQTPLRKDVIEDGSQDPPEDKEPTANLSLPSGQPPDQSDRVSETGIPFKTPAAPALRIKHDLARSLRPLRRKVPSPSRSIFDEAATVEQIAEQGIWSPVLKPEPERWLEVALVIEEMTSLPLWDATIAEFQKLLERQGAFRRVKTWRLQIQGQSTHLVPNWRETHVTTIRESKHLWDSGSRRLILLLSDCTSSNWSDGSILSWLATCNQKAPTAVIQLLPERLWNQTVLGSGTPVWLTALEPGTITAKLQKQRQKSVVEQLLSWAQVKPEKPMMVPVIPLEAEPLKQWAKVMAGCGSSQTIGLQFDLAKGAPLPNIEAQSSVESNETFSPIALVQRFRTSASLIAQELAGLMSVAPVSPQIVDLIRQTLLPSAGTVHVAEVFMGGLMQAYSPKTAGERPTPSTQYEFVPGVRTILSDALPKSKTIEVLDALSRYIAERLGLNINSFAALLKIDFEGNQAAQDLVLPFAAITLPTLQRMGGEYRAIAAHLANTPKVTPPLKKLDLDDLFPLLQTFPFQEAKISFRRKEVYFETATIRFEIKNDGQRLPTFEPLPVIHRIENEQDRYLILNSLSGLLGETHFEEAIEIVRNLPSEEDRVEILGALVPNVSDHYVVTVFELVSNFQTEKNRAELLSAISLHLPEEYASEAINFAQTFVNPYYRAKALSGFLSNLPLEERIPIAQQILELVTVAQLGHDCTLILLRTAYWLPRTESRLLTRCIDAAHIVQDPLNRAHILGTIAPQLPPTQRREVLEQARDSAQQIEDETERAEILNQLSGEWVITRRRAEIQQSLESLDQDLTLALVKIPAGSFTIWASDNDSEQSHHVVTFAQPFLMSQTPITQAQWRYVAGFPQADRELNPNPSNFKGDNRPVEQISWYDAIEFCARLSQFTGRDYRLPSEAEWEYACRAGTQTPFHFGETLSPELANYDASSAFEDGPTGEWREQTTDVRSFPANLFGLYDMHGNVWEWCQDNWHGNIREAPKDGRAWGDKPDSQHVLRGGSWGIGPEYCRSAVRDWYNPDDWGNVVGLRVVCGIART